MRQVEFLKSVAEAAANMSYCNKHKVGAVIAKNFRVISTGYNGTVSGFDNNCEDLEGNTRDIVVHAEQNAIFAAAKEGVSLKDTTMYCTLSPCYNCAKAIIQSGISVLYYTEIYDPNVLHFLQKAGIKCYNYSLLQGASNARE